MFHDETTVGRFNVAQRYRIAWENACPVFDDFCRLFLRIERSVFARGVCPRIELGIAAKDRRGDRLKQKVLPRTLQRLLESIKWDHNEVQRRCRRMRAAEHSDLEAIGVIDEWGTAKSGNHTVCVKRQYNGNRGKIENAVVNVALSFATSRFQCLIDARLYLPKDSLKIRYAEKNACSG
ncbi:MAG: transposase [Pirellulaceae bacterium]|nr:transposase [Pirellulaceae bacterium]